MKKSEEIIIALIQKRLNGRKIALRWKNSYFEKLLKSANLAVGIYISDSNERIDNIQTFPSRFLDGKNKEYYLIVPDLQQNEEENKKYLSLGYKDIDDVLWVNHMPVSYKENNLYGNQLISKSKFDVKFKGFGSSVKIGKNVCYPAMKSLVVHSDSIIEIGNDVTINGCSIELRNGTELYMGNNCLLEGERIFLNVDSKLKIGDGCSFGEGRIRSGRNQSISLGIVLRAS